MKKLFAVTSLYLALPLIAFAQAGGNSGSSYGGNLAPLRNLLDSIGSLVSIAIPILIGIAMVVLIWGIIKYIFKGDVESGRSTIIAGVVGLFVIVSIWGIVRFAQDALLGGSPSSEIKAPHFPQN